MTASKRQIAGIHYFRFAIQPAEFCHRNRLGFIESCVIKYVCRHGSKNGRQDIEKAIHYLQLLLEWEYPDAPPVPVPVRVDPDPHGPDACGLYRDRPVGCAACDEG